MNRIYKVIYSKARQCSIVVSEFAKSSHKNSRKGASHTGTPALARILAAALVAGAVTWGGVPEVSWAAGDTTVNENTVTNTDKTITDINANITGKDNTVIDSSNAEIVGDGNTVTNEAKGDDNSVRYYGSDDARIHGSGNTISASRNQQVIGDNNQIIGRDGGTETGERETNVSDLTIGRGNFIRSAYTWRNKWDSLKVIGNNNRADFKIESAGGPTAGIVIGDNQNIDGINESIVIGSLSPTEQQLSPSGKPKEKGEIDDLYSVGSNSIIIGYHTSNSAGESVVIGNRSQSNGQYQTITGPRSIIEGNQEGSMTGDLASVYGAFNKIKNGVGENEVDGIGNSITGAYNVTSDARGTMIMGLNNTVTHAKAPDVMFSVDDELAASLGQNMSDIWLNVENFGNQYYNDGLNKDDKGNNLHLSYDDAREALSNYMTNSGGVVSVLGNNNSSDYTIRSQILGTNNNLTGKETSFSSNNTISGFSNTGENLKSTSIIGTRNTLKNSEDNVVIGDYHNIDGGKHNVILGSMKSEAKTVTRSYVLPIKPASDDPDMPISLDPIKYTVTEQNPVKDHTNNIENAVMVGYNTDVTQNGGVALGADSVASTEAGIAGFDPQSRKHVNSEKDYSTWVSTDAAVSVGGANREVTYDVLDKDGKPVIDKATGKKKQGTQIVKSTRQITNLAAGTKDTDAVNVAQLKSVNQKVAVVFDDKSSLMSTDATISHEILQDWRFPEGEGQSIALGKNAHAYMQGGWKAYFMLFGMEKAAGAIAIGEGSEALSQSIDIGNRTYTGDMGDVTISKYGNGGSGSGVASVLLGTNSYTGGTLSTLIGDYSIMSTAYPHGYDKHSGSYTQNAGAVSIGALNSIESATTENDNSGIANSIVGLANKTNNANGALIYGAGNTITNSFADVATPDSAGSAAEAAQSFRESVQQNPGGAALAIGGGNKIDHAVRSQAIGVNNTLTGNLYHTPDVNEYSAQYNMVDGYNNNVANVNHAYVIGTNNNIKGKTFSDATKDGVLSETDREKAQKDDNLIVIGDNHTLANDVSNNIILGTADETLTTSASNIVILGHNANAKVEGGVAIGSGSIADTEAGVFGWDPKTKIASISDEKDWKSSWAAVSIGDSTHTRQITNLAAGFKDTDAVNVAQLKAVAEKIGPAMNFVAGDGISIVKKDGVYTISANIKGGSTPTDDVTVEPEKPDEGGNTSGSTSDTLVTPPVKPGNSGNTENPGSTDNPSNGEKLVIKTNTKPTTFVADKGAAAAVKPGETLKINGDKNIMTTASDHGIAISLNKDITVDSVTAGVVTINKDNKGTIGGLTNKTWNSTKITSGQAATEDQLQAATKNAVNYDGDTSKTITLREDTTIKNVADTTIEDGAKNAVNAGTVYNETRVKQDGTYVKVSNTAGENLSALDNQVTSNTQNINYLNGRVGELGDRINKVGAGAAALAALHPLDYDPEDKWDFAVGVGNYRNATAAAVGLFYRPNERTMFNLGWTMGDNRNMVNGGFSLKFGKSNKYIKYSKAEMASVIDKQSMEIAELKARDVQNAKDKAEMKADNAEMKAEIEALKKQVEALAAKK